MLLNNNDMHSYEFYQSQAGFNEAFNIHLFPRAAQLIKNHVDTLSTSFDNLDYKEKLELIIATTRDLTENKIMGDIFESSNFIDRYMIDDDLEMAIYKEVEHQYKDTLNRFFDYFTEKRIYELNNEEIGGI